MSEQIYDVIIIGAGPAGLACARELANVGEGNGAQISSSVNNSNKSLSVLILDKRTILGSKPCGGGICEKETDVPIENSWTKRIIKQEINAEGIKIKMRHSFKRITFEREDLASYQEKLIDGAKNITLLKNVQVKKIFPKFIETDHGSYKYIYLVGADGAASIVRSFLHLPVSLAIGMYYKIWGEFDEFVSYYDLKKIGPGYFWEFPHLTYNNVGVYFDTKYLKSTSAKTILQDYLKSQNYNYDEKDFLAAPINYNYLGYKFDNIFLIGDAGGFTSRMHGGGITNAIISGTEVGKIIKNPKYDTKTIDDLIRSKQRTDKIIEYFYKLPLWVTSVIAFIVVNLYRIPYFQKILPL